MRKPETALRRRILEALEEKFPGGLFLKIHGNPYQEAGIPDFLCSVSGAFIGLEVKLPGQKATPIQLAMGGRIVKSKGYFAVVCSPQQAVDEVTKGVNEVLCPY